MTQANTLEWDIFVLLNLQLYKFMLKGLCNNPYKSMILQPITNHGGGAWEIIIHYNYFISYMF